MIFALLAIAVLVLLVTWLKLNPFIALLISSLALGAMVAAGTGVLTMADVLKAFQTGFGNTLASTWANDSTCASVSGPPCALSNPGMSVLGFPSRMIPRQKVRSAG